MCGAMTSSMFELKVERWCRSRIIVHDSNGINLVMAKYSVYRNGARRRSAGANVAGMSFERRRRLRSFAIKSVVEPSDYALNRR